MPGLAWYSLFGEALPQLLIGLTPETPFRSPCFVRKIQLLHKPWQNANRVSLVGKLPADPFAQALHLVLTSPSRLKSSARTSSNPTLNFWGFFQSILRKHSSVPFLLSRGSPSSGPTTPRLPPPSAREQRPPLRHHGGFVTVQHRR
jgi:hypothetical protein